MPDCPACQAPLLIFLLGKNGCENHLRDAAKMVCPVAINFAKLRMPAERCWIKKDHRRCHHHKTTARPSPLLLLPPFPLFPPYPLLLYTPYYPPTLLCRVCVLVVVVVVFYYILFIYTYLCYIATYIIIYPYLYYIATYIILYDIYIIIHTSMYYNITMSRARETTNVTCKTRRLLAPE